MKIRYYILAFIAIIFFAILLQNGGINRNQKPLSFDPASNGNYNNLKSRLAWQQQRLMDPANGKIPYHIRSKELDFAKSLPSSINNFRNLNWKHLGPYNVGGRTRAGVIDISNEKRILAGGISGGIWISEDEGKNWIKATTPDQLHNVSCLTQDPRSGKTNIWYYGTGEAYGNSASASGAFFAGNGVYKSTDNGLTWNVLESTSSKTLAFDQLWDVVWKVVVDPSKATEDVVYAAVLGAIYRSDDGGDSWTKVLGGSTSSFTYFTDVLCTPTGIVYAALSDDGPDNGIWRSNDGINFTEITPDSFPAGYMRIVMDYNPQNENSIYFLAHTPENGKLGLGYKGKKDWNSLWKYQYVRGDGADSNCIWTNLSENIPAHAKMGFDDFNAQGSYNLVVKFKPNDSNTIFIGGTNVYRSNDGFLTDQNTVQIGGYGVGTKRPNWSVYENHHPDQHVIQFLPSNSNVLINFNDGGIFRSEDCMASHVNWTPLNNGYLTTQVYTINFEDNATNDMVIAGFQDNGNYFTNSSDSKANWVMPMNGDGSYNAVASNQDFFLFSSQLGKIAKMKLDKNGNKLEFTRIDPIGATNYQFINPFVVDPNDEDILYLPAGRQIWRNNQLKTLPYISNYDSISTGWFMLTDSLDNAGRTFSTISVTKKNPAHRLYLGTTSRYLYRVDNANTGDPEIIRINNAKLPSGHIGCIAIDPEDGDHILVVYTNYGIVSLLASTDGGDNWSKVAGNLEEKSDGTGNGPSTRWAEITYIDGQRLYLVGTSVGLFATDSLNDMQTVWVNVGSNTIGNVVVEMVKVRQNDGFLVVGTHGNAIYTTHINSIHDVLGIDIRDHSNVVSIGPNPAKDYVHIESRYKIDEVTIYGLNGQLLLKQNNISANTFSQNIQKLTSGIYLIEITSNSQKVTKKIQVIN